MKTYNIPRQRIITYALISTQSNTMPTIVTKQNKILENTDGCVALFCVLFCVLFLIV